MSINELEKFYEFYYKLEQIPRTGWIMRNVPEERTESIADHTLQTIMLSTIIAKDLNLNLNYEKLYQMLLIHDLAEVIIGDISEISEEHKSKREKEEEAIKEILKTLPENIAQFFLRIMVKF